MISIKGHIRVLENGQEPLNLTRYSTEGFPELTFSTWEELAKWGKEREAEERERESDGGVKVAS